jgi:hypothetical protein
LGAARKRAQPRAEMLLIDAPTAGARIRAHHSGSGAISPLMIFIIGDAFSNSDDVVRVIVQDVAR